jgi:FkbM family methyltransferase
MPINDIDFDYQLDKMSVVMDIGGYEGDFADLMRRKYNCGVHIFEPTIEKFRHIKERFHSDPMVWPYYCALEDENKYGDIFLCNNASSIYHKTDRTETIKIRDIYFFVIAFKFFHIDLLKMNCEGSEYKILKRLIEKDWLKNVRQIVVQFHGIPAENKEELEALLYEKYDIKHKCDYWQWLKLK